MKKTMKQRLCAGGLCLALGAAAFGLAGCNNRVQAADLMAGVEPQTVANTVDIISTASPMDFAVNLFQAGLTEGENSLLSPVSVLYALAMTANGAAGETRAQMEAVLGMSVEDLNAYLYAYKAALPAEEGFALHLANSIWLREDERLTVEPAFLQANADYYGAGIFEAPFDDSTLQDINQWIEENTAGRIPDMLDRIPADAVLYLINALALDAKWQSPFDQPGQVRPGTFTLEDGTTREVVLMHEQLYTYYEDEGATGFLKYYEGGAYAFVALLPKEGSTVGEYAQSLTGDDLRQLLQNPQEVPVNIALPKFEAEYELDLAEALSSLGMPDAFDPNLADFSAMGQSTAGPLFLSRVLHRTVLAVDEEGTQAAAATIVEANDGAAMEPEEPKEVILDRPFLYMIVDTETYLPIFIGTAMDV